jgi:hypothetical protein
MPLKQLRAGQAAEAVADSLRLLLLVLPFKATAELAAMVPFTSSHGKYLTLSLTG